MVTRGGRRGVTRAAGGGAIPGAPEYGKRGAFEGGKKMALYESAASFFRRMYLGGGYFLIHRLDNPAGRPAAKGCTETIRCYG